jgi:hypothetical protein
MDLMWAYTMCSPRVILVHDATNDEQHPGVRQAVDAFSKYFNYPYKIWPVQKGWAVFSRENLPDTLT